MRGRSWCLAEFHSFDDMGLSEDLLRGIYSFGFHEPSAIQKRAIVPLSKMCDVLAKTAKGTGTTVAFVIGACRPRR